MSVCQNSNEYLHRIHIVQDYIENHLKEPILLDDLTNISGFSKYHFHRIFKSIVGESLSHYIKRIKLEKFLQEHGLVLDNSNAVGDECITYIDIWKDGK